VTSAPDRRRRDAVSQVLVADLDRCELGPEDRHHLETVLRLRDGEMVVLADGSGSWRLARWGRNGQIDPVTDIEVVPRRRPRVAVAFALLKGDRNDLVVQKLTEIGVEVIIPVLTRRCVVRWDPSRADKAVTRWERIAREAWGQSRGNFLPVIEPVSTWEDLIGRHRVVVAEPGGDPPEVVVGTGTDPLVIAIGPEGGFDPDELDVVTPRLGLPGGILRAETASIVAAALIVAAVESVGHP
jgi:16S rRNA (uracil1498-N3)-methyltransferase